MGGRDGIREGDSLINNATTAWALTTKNACEKDEK
jgi:hypothetical protein